MSGKLQDDEADGGMLILTQREDHIRCSSGEVLVSHSVKQLITRFDRSTEYKADVEPSGEPYDTSDWEVKKSDKDPDYIAAWDVAIRVSQFKLQ